MGVQCGHAEGSPVHVQPDDVDPDPVRPFDDTVAVDDDVNDDDPYRYEREDEQ